MKDMIKAGIALIFIGAVLLFAGMILSAQKADFAGLIMIGPVPVAFGTSPDITLAAMFLGLVLMLMFFILGRRSEKRTDFEENSKRESEEMKVKAGGVVLIGPVPIIFGSDKRSALLAMVLAIVILLLAIILLK